MEFLVGHQNMIQGFEQELLGAEKEKIENSLYCLNKPMDIEMKMLYRSSKEQFPTDLEVGMMFLLADQGPMQFSNEILEDTVKIDFNHPMAGKTLKFNVEVISIRVVKKKLAMVTIIKRIVHDLLPLRRSMDMSNKPGEPHTQVVYIPNV